VTSGELSVADAYCRSLAHRHYENFSVASIFLPANTRLHLARLYAYCRVTDDLGDESASAALPRLVVWQEQVEQCLGRGPDPIHPVLLALRQTVAACHLPARPFLDLIAANMQDQVVSEYATWQELRSYCYLSAAPVGRLVLGIWGITGSEAERLSDDVCIGLQLANFAQDVAVDRMKGRTYLTQADITRYGLEGAIRSLCDRAEGLLASGHELESLVPERLRLQLTLYRLGGLAIISAIRSIDYRTDAYRPHLSVMAKLRLITIALAENRRRKGYVPHWAA
jgi:squalene synthase HpnC